MARLTLESCSTRFQNSPELRLQFPTQALNHHPDLLGWGGPLLGTPEKGCTPHWVVDGVKQETSGAKLVWPAKSCAQGWCHHVGVKGFTMRNTELKPGPVNRPAAVRLGPEGWLVLHTPWATPKPPQLLFPSPPSRLLDSSGLRPSPPKGMQEVPRGNFVKETRQRARQPSLTPLLLPFAFFFLPEM